MPIRFFRRLFRRTPRRSGVGLSPDARQICDLLEQGVRAAHKALPNYEQSGPEETATNVRDSRS